MQHNVNHNYDLEIPLDSKSQNISQPNEIKSLVISSFNVNGLCNKVIYPYFFDFLCSKDVFFCLETHVLQHEKLNQLKRYFPNFNLHWKLAERISSRGRGSEGMLIGWSTNLVNKLNFQVEITEEDEFTILRLQKGLEVFNIMPVYLRSENWRASFLNLKEYIVNNSFPNLIVIGDVNIRLGELQQEIVPILHNNPKIQETRNSQDKVINSMGIEYMEMCDDFNLRILNGAFFGDEEGAFTYSSSIGNSVNDIAAVSNTIIDKIQSFKVENETWSDHFPISVEIEVGNSHTTENMKLLPKLIWVPDKCQEYLQKIDQQLAQSEDDNNNLMKINQIIKSAAPATIKKRMFRKNPWFDSDCERARKQSFKNLMIWRREYDAYLKEIKKVEYIESKKKYTQLLKHKQGAYWEDLKHKLNTVRGTKEWWALSKKYNNQHFTSCTAIHAQEFKTYFEKLLGENSPSCEYSYAPFCHQDTILDANITIEEVHKALNKLKDGKAPGEDRITYEFYKYSSPTMIQALANTFTCILNSGSIEETFRKNIIFPVHKKGDITNPSNYRGLSFMNSGPKIMMSIMNTRLSEWVNTNQKLNEFQAGFRPNYSTVDNIYNLSCIAHLKLREKKKLYAFFVDFKAAFDCVPRNALLYKLRNMGVSWKFCKFVEHLYNRTITTVWNGDTLSEYFETKSGVRQGCLMSPLLFALYINDMHEELGGGFWIDELQMRILMYADDVVILADNSVILQDMIRNLEKYCINWGMTVNLSKSKILVFRNGGRLSQQERWVFNGAPIDIVGKYEYLGVLFTPKVSYTQHIQERSKKAKRYMNGIWQRFLSDKSLDIQLKLSIFKSVVRGVQSYSGEVFGYGYKDEIDKLQLYFLKHILRLPQNTPTYAIFLETREEPSHLYCRRLHMKYIFKTLFKYDENRLPHQLSRKVIARRIFWFKEWCNSESSTLVRWNDVPMMEERWKYCIQAALQNVNINEMQRSMERKNASQNRFYKHLSSCNEDYLRLKLKTEYLSLIIKARTDELGLNSNRYREIQEQKCTICNSNEIENIVHFIGRCPVLSGVRRQYLQKLSLHEREIVEILNGNKFSWNIVANFVKRALTARRVIMSEFNF